MPLRSQTRRPGLGKRWGTGAWVPEELPDWKCGGSPRNLYFLFGFSVKGWRNRMGTGLVAVWPRTGTFLKVVGAGSVCSVVQFLWDTSSALSSLPLPLGRVSNTNKPKAHSPSQVYCGGTRGRVSLSLLLPPAFLSNINGRENHTDASPLNEEQPPTQQAPQVH